MPSIKKNIVFDRNEWPPCKSIFAENNFLTADDEAKWFGFLEKGSPKSIKIPRGKIIPEFVKGRKGTSRSHRCHFVNDISVLFFSSDGIYGATYGTQLLPLHDVSHPHRDDNIWVLLLTCLRKNGFGVTTGGGSVGCPAVAVAPFVLEYGIWPKPFKKGSPLQE